MYDGLYGLLLGLTGGYVITILLGSVSVIGLFKKKDRESIARKFMQDNKNEILNLKKFEKMDYEKIINILSEYIEEIYRFANKLENPVKRHPHDLEIASLRPNFKKGAENWLLKFELDEENALMKKYINFLDHVIYEDSSLIKKSID
jgi:Zn/Cd-binding protein ZinT